MFGLKEKIDQHAFGKMLDVMGIFCLLSFIISTFLAPYIAALLPQCIYHQALVLSMKCSGIAGNILALYFNMFSPFILALSFSLPIALFSAFYNLDLLLLVQVVIWIVIVGFIYYSTIRTLVRIAGSSS